MDFSNFANRTGAAGQDEVDALMKALTAGYGTDVATLTGGAALRVQSLDTIMQATIQENQHFKLFNKLRKPRAGATVDEWTEQNGVGGFLGGSTNTETGNIANATGSYNRRVGQVKYLMTQRQVSLVQTLQTAIADSEAIEYANGALQLLSDAEFLSFEGNSAVVPTEFDGIYYQLQNGINGGTVDGNHIIDAAGQPVSSITLINQAVATVTKFKNFGRSTDIFLSPLTQADFDTGLDPTFRVPLNDVPGGGISLGAPVVGIRTSNGHLAMNSDVFVRDDDMQIPFEVQQPSIAAANTYTPVSLTAGAPASSTNSAFLTAQAGNYYYYVTGTTAAGESVGVKSAQVAISAGQAVALTITRSAAATETGYVIYRSRLNGGNITGAGSADGMSDFRVMARVPVAGATTVYTDYNRDIPGTSKAYILNMTPGDTAILWRQLLPMLKFALYPTQNAVIPWAQLLFGYLRISKLRHHVVIKNIVTNGATFRPFN
jgi:hypothetical protein